MAKVAFSKLKSKINDTEASVKIGEEIVMVKQYLPIQTKLELIGRIIELAHDQDYNYDNPVKRKVFSELEILFAYSNITFTDKQKEDLPKLYDLLSSSGILGTILNAIPENELALIKWGVDESVESVYKYQNSVLGILDTLKKDYSNVTFDMQEVVNQLKNGEVDLNLVKGLLTNSD